MRDKKELWEIVNSVSNYETRQMLSSKPFKPGFLDMILSKLAPQFYSAQELRQIKKLQSLVGFTTTNTTEKNQNQRLIRKKRSIIQRDEEMVDEEEAPLKPLKKKPRKKIASENVQELPVETRTTKTTGKNQNQRAIRESDEEMHSHSNVEATKAENNQRVTRKRRRIPIQEMLLDDEEGEAVAKPAKKKSTKKIASENVQELPVEIRNRIAEPNGTNTQFLMSKKLYNTDVTANNNRLSMPENKIKCEFLINEAEKERTREGAGFAVTVLDPSLREHSLILKKWKMNSVFVYNLIKNWNKVVSENEFQEDHELQIWSFRVTTKLYFVLNKV